LLKFRVAKNPGPPTKPNLARTVISDRRWAREEKSAAVGAKRVIAAAIFRFRAKPPIRQKGGKAVGNMLQEKIKAGPGNGETGPWPR